MDEKKDLDLIRNIYSFYKPNKNFGWDKLKKLIIKKPKKFDKNKSIMRNSKIKNKGQELWNKAKKIIPNGNMLLSKRPELFYLTDGQLTIQKAKGCMIWDLQGNKYIDMSFMGVGTNILGYSNQKINKSVFNAISKSNLSTLNCPEEVSLAEKLISIHPWADMVKFARTGGEANSIAIRIAKIS